MQNNQESCDAPAPGGGAGGIARWVRPELALVGVEAVSVPALSAPRAARIPGLVVQPERLVRAAYWRAKRLIDAGWRIHALGRAESRFGFIAEIPHADSGTALVVFPRARVEGDSAAAALLRDLRWLNADQRNHLRRLLDALHASAAVSDVNISE